MFPRGDEHYSSVWDRASRTQPPVSPKVRREEWSSAVKCLYESTERITTTYKWGHHARKQTCRYYGTSASLNAERLRSEFAKLSAQWRRETRHLSLVQKKIIHPAYLRIIGLGEAVVPLLLEALRDEPAHWFTALKATTNVDPCPPNANPAIAREAWLTWGKSHGYIS